MRKHTKRKVYGLIYDPITYLKEGMAATPEDCLNILRARELSAIEALSKGKGGLNEWRQMTEMLNIAETMAGAGIGPEVMPVCLKAQNELITAAKRFETTKRMGLTATGLFAIRELFAFHDAQRTAITRGEYERAIRTTQERVRTHAGKIVDVSEVMA